MIRFLVTLLMILMSSSYVIGQDTYRKRYRVPYKLEYKERIQKIKTTTKDGIEEVTKKGVSTKNIEFIIEDKKGKKKENSKGKHQYDSIVLQVYKGSKIDDDVKALAERNMWANVAFSEQKGEKDFLLVNPWLISDGDGGYINRESIYYFKLKNRRVVKLEFRQWSLNALSVPLKMRFAKGVATEFSSDANLGAVFGYTCGSTKFVYRKGIGNKQYDRKFTSGIFLGAGKAEYSFVDDTGKNISVKNGLLSTGIALLRSYQNFTYGITGGFDFSLGENSSDWDFQGQPWLGVSIGYSLFSF